jgi:hypothetical protein
MRFYVNQMRTAMVQAATPASSDGDDDRKPNPWGTIFKDFDVDKLPSAEVMARYFGVSDGYSVMDTAGFRSVMTMRYPNQ